MAGGHGLDDSMLSSSVQVRPERVTDVSVQLQVSPPDQMSSNWAYCKLAQDKVVPFPLPTSPRAPLSHWCWRNCKEARFDSAGGGTAEPRALWESKTVSGL